MNLGIGAAPDGPRPKRRATAELRRLSDIRRQVATVQRMVVDDRPVPCLLRWISAVRADLRAVERRLVFGHARRSILRALPGETLAPTRRRLLERWGGEALRKVEVSREERRDLTELLFRRPS